MPKLRAQAQPPLIPSAWRGLSEWEQERIILPMQKHLRSLDWLAKLLGYGVQGEGILPILCVPARRIGRANRQPLPSACVV